MCIHVCRCEFMCSTSWHMQVEVRGLLHPLALELQVPVRHLIWMLGTNLESYARAENAFLRDQKEMVLIAETSLL